MGSMSPQIDARGGVFGPNVVIHDSAVISDGCELGAGCYIGPRVRLGRGCVIGPGAVIGSPGFGFKPSSDGYRYEQKEHSHGVTIGDDVTIGANTCIDAGSWRTTTISDGARVDNLVHIAHNVIVGKRAVVVALAELSGSVEVGEGAWIGPSACVIQRAKIGAHALVGLGSVVLKDVEPNTTVAGNPARVINDQVGVREVM